LARAADAFYGSPSKGLNIIGVTGTNGKTTTTLLLKSILEHAGYAVGVIGTLSYQWGDRVLRAPMTTPESVDLQALFHQMREDEISHVVMEVSSHSLALGRVRGCEFRVGVFTNLSQDHLDFHATLEEYYSAKILLFKKYLASNDKESIAVINGDDPYGIRLFNDLSGNGWCSEQPSTNTRNPEKGSAISRVLWDYSVSLPSGHGANTKGTGADQNQEHTLNRVFVKDVHLDASGIRCQLATPRGILTCRSPLLGRLNLYNILAASTTAYALGVGNDSICRGIEAVRMVDGRLQSVPTSTGYDVVVDYAHTPDAMEKSLACLRELTQGRLLVVFGCGGDRDQGKRPLMGEIASRLGDVVIITSDNPRTESPEAIIRDVERGLKPRSAKGEYIVEVDRRKAIRLALSLACPGDMVVIGGKGHETYQIIGDQKHPFDDRLEVLSYLESTE
jgi:UDP-N-acetylmuramoyl-L-alanyl-D-glutamate--2,6-diaminopimelate ligase